MKAEIAALTTPNISRFHVKIRDFISANLACGEWGGNSLYFSRSHMVYFSEFLMIRFVHLVTTYFSKIDNVECILLIFASFENHLKRVCLYGAEGSPLHSE